VRDGNDRDFIPIGSTQIDAEQQLETKVILTFWAPDGESAAPELAEVEVAAASIYVKCDYIGPSF
jgi:hypothetical protein